MDFYHHHSLHHRTTAQDSVHTHFSYLNAQHIFLTVILFPYAYDVQERLPSLCFLHYIFLVSMS